MESLGNNNFRADKTYYFAVYNPEANCVHACSVCAYNESQAEAKISEQGLIVHYAIRNQNYLKRHFGICVINI